jgi:hypothetical protein
MIDHGRVIIAGRLPLFRLNEYVEDYTGDRSMPQMIIKAGTARCVLINPPAHISLHVDPAWLSIVSKLRFHGQTYLAFAAPFICWLPPTVVGTSCAPIDRVAGYWLGRVHGAACDWHERTHGVCVPVLIYGEGARGDRDDGSERE